MKNSLKYFYFFVFISIWLLPCHSQNNTIDSLTSELKIAVQDSVKCKLLLLMIEKEGDDNIWPKYNQQLLLISEENLKNESLKNNKKVETLFLKYKAEALNNIGYINNVKGNFELALYYYYKSIKIREQINDKKGIANSLSNIGVIYFNQGKLNKVLETYKKGLNIQKEIGDKKGMGLTLNNIGFLLFSQGDIPNSIDYFNKNLKLQEEINNKDGIAVAYNNIAKILDSQGETPKALEMSLKCLKYRKETNNKQGIAECMSNISLIYVKQGDTSKALDLNAKALKILQDIDYKNGMGYILNNIASIYLNKGNYDSASKYINESVRIREELKDKKGLAEGYYSLGFLNLKKNQLSVATIYGNKSLLLAKELGYPTDIFKAAALMYRIYKKQNNSKLALDMYQLYTLMHDSINNQESKKAAIKTELKYEYEKKAAADSVRVAEEKKLTTIKLKQEKIQRYFLYGGLGLTVLFGIFMFNRFRITNRQKTIIQQQKNLVENQKNIVDEKQKEILDSIHYAKRIQQSLLPTEKYIERILKKEKLKL